MGDQDDIVTLHETTSRLDLATKALHGRRWRLLARTDLTVPADLTPVTQAAVQGALRRLAAGDPEGAVHFLEEGRGLSLYAATETRTVADRLEEAGKLDLARQWRAAAGVPDPQHLPPELRGEVMATLRAHSPAAALIDPPRTAEIQTALTTVDADALVHLLPGHAVITPVAGPVVHLPLPDSAVHTGHVERFLAALSLHGAYTPAEIAERLDRLCRWAWHAVVGPLLATVRTGAFGRPPRIILVPLGGLARVPWHAARRADDTYAVQLASISQVTSARMLCRTASQPPTPAAASALILGDPDTGDLSRPMPAAGLEAAAIAKVHFPSGRHLGRPLAADTEFSIPESPAALSMDAPWGFPPAALRSPSGAGTLDQVRAWLTTTNPNAGGTLHLSSPGYGRTGLRLAGGDHLTPAEILSTAERAQGRNLDLAVLNSCRTGMSVASYDEVFSLATAFLAAGVRSVLATQWNAPDGMAPALTFMAHRFHQSGRPAWAALRDAQLWMLDPARRIPSEMPAELAALVADADPADAVGWAAMSHWGA